MSTITEENIRNYCVVNSLPRELRVSHLLLYIHTNTVSNLQFVLQNTHLFFLIFKLNCALPWIICGAITKTQVRFQITG